MANEVISYREMCDREGSSLQRGMNFNIGGRNYSVILMSVQANAPYRDRFEEDGEVLIYEGHDVPKTKQTPKPKRLDQVEKTFSGTLTENGKFHKSAKDYIKGTRQPERVKVYEKIRSGIWSYNGVFHLVDSWLEKDHHRSVFKFKLVAVEGDEDFSKPVDKNLNHRRVIPTTVKLEVWKRDNGKCVKCSAPDELHFDHVLPFAKGGTSMTAENVQLLCARHNLEKRDKII
jgi:hypothetical protein